MIDGLQYNQKWFSTWNRGITRIDRHSTAQKNYSLPNSPPIGNALLFLFILFSLFSFLAFFLPYFNMKQPLQSLIDVKTYLLKKEKNQISSFFSFLVIFAKSFCFFHSFPSFIPPFLPNCHHSFHHYSPSKLLHYAANIGDLNMCRYLVETQKFLSKTDVELPFFSDISVIFTFFFKTFFIFFIFFSLHILFSPLQFQFFFLQFVVWGFVFSSHLKESLSANIIST